jgi:hypothetical protein
MNLAGFAEDYQKLTLAEQAQFEETVRRLLTDSLIWRETEDDRKAYSFLVRRRDLVADYLIVAGWELGYDERLGIFHVHHRDGAHRRRLDRDTTLWLLILRLFYAEQRESLTVTLHRYPAVTIGEIYQRYAEFFPGRAIRKKSSLDEALRTLRTLKLVRAAGNAPLRTGDPEQLIELLPTLEVVVSARDLAQATERLREYQTPSANAAAPGTSAPEEGEAE